MLLTAVSGRLSWSAKYSHDIIHFEWRIRQPVCDNTTKLADL